MILDLMQLKRAGKDRESFFFEYTPERELCDIPDTEIICPIKISGEIVLIDEHSARLVGEVCYTLAGSCTRCLAKTEKQYLICFDEIAGKEDGYDITNDKINLTQIVDDAIVMNMPVKFLCKEDCKGICTTCGANLNETDCKCNKEGR